MNPIITVEQLIELQSNEDVILIDSRYGGPINDQYLEGHLEGALFVDLDRDLADIKENPADGGRHPLPTVGDFVAVLNRLGINNSSRVVIYDNNTGAFAARMWWMLRSIGHETVQVLEGGFDYAKVHYPVSSGDEKTPQSSSYKAENWNWPIASMEEVESSAKSNNHVVIDVRGEERFNGKNEPIDLIAGHIPGAINVPFVSNFKTGHQFLSSDELKKKYQEILSDVDAKQVIVHCGSGVTACHTILAMAQAQMEIPKLYVGSWSEWSRNDKSMVTAK